MIEIRITIADKGIDADPDPRPEIVNLHVNRCRLPRCQTLLESLKKDFCSDGHRSEFHNKYNPKN